jgi:hypothetical protein
MGRLRKVKREWVTMTVGEIPTVKPFPGEQKTRYLRKLGLKLVPRRVVEELIPNKRTIDEELNELLEVLLNGMPSKYFNILFNKLLDWKLRADYQSVAKKVMEWQS